MAEYKEHMKNIYSVIVEYEKISNSHMVDFITENLWESALPKDFHISYKEYKDESIEKHPSVIKLYKLLESLKLCNIKNVKKQLNIETLKEKENNLRKKGQEFHTDKKWHEIDRFSKVIKEMTKDDLTVIIDAGAGKGYLSMILSENYNIPVLAVESSCMTYHNALNHQNLVKKKTHQSFQLVKYTMKHIDENTNYSELVGTNFSNFHIKNNLTLVGLHTCGTLAHSMAKSFVNCEDVKTLCVVPCCYHLADKSLNCLYKFSKNQRMLAQQRAPKSFKVESYCPSLFYRAVLQVVFHSLGIKNAKIGRSAPLDNFSTYAKWALKKVGISEKEMPSSEFLEEMYKKHLKEKWKFDVFHALRLLIAPILEVAILIDIVLYLYKNVKCVHLELKQIFNELISPRSYAIIATK